MQIIDISLIALGIIGCGFVLLSLWQWHFLYRGRYKNALKISDYLTRPQWQALRLSSAYIHEGVWIFLQRKILILFAGCLVVTLVIGGFLGSYTAIFFAGGAALALIASLISIQASIGNHHAIVLRAYEGIDKSLERSLKTASIAGLSVAGLVLLTLCIVLSTGYYQELARQQMFAGVTSLILGSVTVSFFMRLGGGIFTKGADVGLAFISQNRQERLAIEKNQQIQEDKTRPRVTKTRFRRVDIANLVDQVGDNIGDVPGIASDFIDSVLIALVSCWLLALAPISNHGLLPMTDLTLYLSYPLLCLAVTIFSTLPGFYVMHLGDDRSILASFYRGFGITVICALIGTSMIGAALFEETEAVRLIICVGVGHFMSVGLCSLAHFVTGQQNITLMLNAASRGPAATTLQGFVAGLQSCAGFGIFFLSAAAICYISAGLFGIVLAAVTLSGYLALIVTFGVFAPIADNAHGAATMNNFPESIQLVTRQLDRAGHIAKGVTKLFTTGVTFLSGICLLLLFLVYLPLEVTGNWFEDQALLPYFLFGLLLGCCVPFLFCGFTLQVVGQAAVHLLDNITLLKQEGKETYKHAFQSAIMNLSNFSLQAMIKPVLLVFGAPFIGFSILFFWVGASKAFVCLLGGSLAILPVAFFLSILFNTSGLLWNNAKYEVKFQIGTEDEIKKMAAALKLSDVVGDPFKDSLGPSLNPMIKLSGIFSLILLSVMMIFQI